MMAQSEQTTFSLGNVTDMTSTPPANTSSGVPVPQGCVLKQVSEFVPWNHKDNIVSWQAETIIKILLTGVLQPLLFLVSFSTNTLNMVVFYKQGLRERINMCLFTLSLVDLLSVTAAYGYSSDVLYMFLREKSDELGPVSQFFIRTHLIGLHGLAPSSHIVSSVVALERCLCVTHPLLVKNLMSTKKTAVVMWSLMVIVSSSVFVVGGMRFGLICVFDARDNSTSYQIYPSDFVTRNQLIVDVINGIVFGIFFPALCFICVTVCTIITVVKMKRLSEWRESVSSGSEQFISRDLSITRMIVGTSVLFIACGIPSIMYRAAVLISPEIKLGGRYHNLYKVFGRFYQVASSINCSFNFFIYYSYGSKFRHTLRQMFATRSCYRDKEHTGQNKLLKQ